MLALLSHVLCAAAVFLTDTVATPLPEESTRVLASPPLRIPAQGTWDRLPESDFSPLTAARPEKTPKLLRIALRPPRPGRWWLVSDMEPLDLRVQCGPHRFGPVGAAHAFQATHPATDEMAIPLDLSGSPQQLHLLVTDPRLPGSWNRFGMRLVPESVFAAWAERRAQAESLLIGFSIALVLMAASLWLSVREAAFGWYTAYLASYLVWLVFSARFGRSWAWPGLRLGGATHGYVFSYAAVFSCSSVGCFCRFLVSLLDLGTRMPRLARSLQGMSIIGFLVAATVLLEINLGLPSVPWLAELVELSALALIATAVIRSAAKEPLARRLLFSFSPLWVATAVGCLIEMRYIPASHAFKKHFVAACMLCENVLTTLVLAGEVLSRERRRLELERDFHGKVMERSDEYRKEIAYELHDDIGQQAVALRLRLHRLHSQVLSGKVLHDLDARVEMLVWKVRELSHDLHPPQLACTGLEAALQGLCAEQERLSECRIRLVSASAESSREYAAGISAHFFRIAQQAVANATSHGKARNIEIGLERLESRLRLTVQDDGIGFSPESVHQGLGLEGIRSRTVAMGGKLTVESSPGAGTRLCVDIPLPPSDDSAQEDGTSD